MHQSKLTKLSVTNYKAFAERAELELRPLTLLYGFNSVGKSALLRALPMLAASSDGRQRSPLATNSPVTRAAAFSDLLCRGNSSETLEFSLQWRSDTGQTLEVTIAVRELASLRTQVIEKMVISYGEGVAAEALWLPEDNLKGGGNSYSLKIGNVVTKVSMSFRGLVPAIDAGSSAPAEFIDLVEDLKHCLNNLSKSVNWLSALRVVPERYERFMGAREGIGYDGQGAGQALADDVTDEGALLEIVSRWYEEATDHTLSLSEFALGSGVGFSLQLTDTRNKLRSVNLVDTGEGMGQVLPVLVLGALASGQKLECSPLLCIEHPELHLQPSTHGYLASYFSRVIKQAPETTVLIETHSESLLLQVQLQIATGKLGSDKVIVYWLGRGETGAPNLEKITFDDLGRANGRNWPRSAFSTATDLSKEIVAERRQRELASLDQVPQTHEG